MILLCALCDSVVGPLPLTDTLGGVGSSLIEAVAAWARAEGFQRLLLDVADGNASAMALYTQAGFVATGVVGTLPPPRAHIREIQMALTL